MYDLHAKMNTFYHQHVRLPPEKRKELGDHRDTNLKRLRQGLDKISEQDGISYAYPVREPDQGSYAMHTLNQRPSQDYDIDVAIIFREVDLPSTPIDARKHIERAFKEAGGNFKSDPKARTNAVTVWYVEGYHIDFAVYRESDDGSGNIFTEHAGAEWKRRDPVEITDWFTNQVRDRSPLQDYGAKVESRQFRKIVRLLKMFAKSRDSWALPGGIIVSKLVEECYRPHTERDDIALYETMSAIRARLLGNVDVYDPIHIDQKLTYKSLFHKQVERFRDALGDIIDNHLYVLFQNDCTEPIARKAWCEVFNHEFWCSDEESNASLCDVSNDRPTRYYVLGIPTATR
jgi:hypothetical protein